MQRALDGVRYFRAPPNDILMLIKLSGEERVRKIATAVKMDLRAALPILILVTISKECN